jgi:hypothetical protein
MIKCAMGGTVGMLRLGVHRVMRLADDQVSTYICKHHALDPHRLPFRSPFASIFSGQADF